ncbi:PLP-dependent aminotransferase family protein [Aliiroseovarius sp. 2305UL8-7]|uniref:MocR-like pyridoxine biosynthesis transcription factor PdxR n=1 Tax=Aliiroseovarius conchicola TaxID=3121637 RepID=UPI003526DCA2
MTNYALSKKANLQRELLAITLDTRATGSLQSQLVAALRRIVSSSPNAAGERLPASRMLAEELSVSRTTVQAAYDQLISEGIFAARQGSGTFITDEISHLIKPLPQVKRLADPPTPRPWQPFQVGLPDQSLMPHKLWSQHLERAWRDPDTALLASPDLLGWYPLREAIADHLEAWRGLACDPEQVVITSGAREAFELVFNGLLGVGQHVAIEDPCWPKLRAVLEDTGNLAHPVKIDAEGFNPAAIPQDAEVVVISPSRHYPTGVSLPLPRRLSLLAWAEQCGGLVIEDDYDSEFRYRGQPLPSLCGLDGLRRTLYLGSFSKLISPALRIGYLVVKKEYLPKLRAHLARVGARASLVPQPALATFMQGGDYATHLRRMRRTYGRRQRHLLAALAPVSELLDLQTDPSGMHLCLSFQPELAERTTDVAISELAMKAGLSIDALSAHNISPNGPQGLLLGYAGFDEDALTAAARVFADQLHSFLKGKSSHSNSNP